MADIPATQVRALTRAELDTALDWAALEGWNPGLDDAAAFHAADPGGFFGIFLDGEMAGSLSAVRYGGEFAFLGLYIVRPEYRGRGHGLQLWRTVLDGLDGRVVGLDGVVERQADYARSGFATAYRNVRYGGLAGQPVPVDPAVVAVAELPFALVADYDAGLFPARREGFLKAWIAPPGGAALGFLDGDRLAGYGVARRCRNGYKIGPLFAEDAAVAEALFMALRNHAGEGRPIFLDIPEPNAAALALARREGMALVFETARMYRGGMPADSLGRIFGITTFELG